MWQSLNIKFIGCEYSPAILVRLYQNGNKKFTWPKDVCNISEFNFDEYINLYSILLNTISHL